MSTSLINAQYKSTSAQQEEALYLTNDEFGQDELGNDESFRSHILGLPQLHETLTVKLYHDTAISLTTSLEDATIRMIDDRIVIDFVRVRGGRIVLDLTEAGSDAIFSARITPCDGVSMPAFDAFFHALSTELDFPISDVAWALAKVVQLDTENFQAAEKNAYLHIAAE